MTKQEKYRLLQEQRNEKIPEAMKLDFGCDCIDEANIEWAKNVTCTTNGGDKVYFREPDGSIYWVKNTSTIKILGRPVTLQDVLRMLPEDTEPDFGLYYGVLVIFIPTDTILSDKIEIDLTKSIEDQDEEVIDKLLELTK